MYTPQPNDLARIANDFTFHSPIPERNQAERYETIRGMAKELAHRLLTLCPPSRELSVALTNLDQVVFWANASIARNEKAS